MAKTLKSRLGEPAGEICKCEACGQKFIDTTGSKSLMCPKCIGKIMSSRKLPNISNTWLENGTYHCKTDDGKEWISPDGKNWEEKHNDSLLPQIEAQLYAQSLESPWGDLPPTQQKIHEIMGAMKDLLLYKNQKYGDSAINPKKIFYKGDSTNSILIRLDDKIGRVMSNTEEKPRVNDVCDIIGYCTLLLISMGVTSEDIAKFKD